VRSKNSSEFSGEEMMQMCLVPGDEFHQRPPIPDWRVCNRPVCDATQKA
jgi:hypothetical protein